MKLRNKKTGKIRNYEFVVISKDMDVEFAKYAHHSPVLICRSINQLNEEWEDYKPKESLIKDEKIRKAIRAWAGTNCFEEVKYFDKEFEFECEEVCIQFSDNQYFQNLEDGNAYTIEELCGEEENEWNN